MIILSITYINIHVIRLIHTSILVKSIQRILCNKSTNSNFKAKNVFKRLNDMPDFNHLHYNTRSKDESTKNRMAKHYIQITRSWEIVKNRFHPGLYLCWEKQ